MSSIVVYPGTFDPITNGHLDIITRAAQLFDKVIVAVAASARKSPAFSLTKRLEFAKQAVAELGNKVEVFPLEALLIDFVRQHKARIILRGLRAVSDFEYELQLVGMNRKLAPEIETLFLAPSEQYAFISATVVREIIAMNGDVSAFVPPRVMQMLRQVLTK